MVGNYITSFIGFMPADDPQVIVYVAVDNAKGITQYGGTVAAPIAKNILKSTIDILNIKPRKNEMEKEFVYLDPNYIKVPNVIGKDLKEAKKILKGFNIKVEGTGKVIYQAPQSGTKINEGETVRIYLN